MATEFHLEFKEGFKQGLRREDTNEKNSQLLTYLTNVRVTEHGLKAPIELRSPFSSFPETVVFPFPQLFVGKGVTLLAYDTSIYQVNSSWDDPTTPLSTWRRTGAGDLIQADIPSTRGCWHFIDLGEFWMLTRDGTVVEPGCTIFYLHKEGMWSGGEDVVELQSTRTIGCGCSHRGRIILGRFDYGNFWNSTWGSLFTYWQNTAPSGAHTSFEAEVDAPGANYVMWSSIGGGDFPLCLFEGHQDLVSTPGMLPATPGYSESEPWIFQALRRNEIGWMPMPFQGSVLAIKPLGNDVIVYGSNGIVRMSNVNVGLGVAMSCQRISDVGILSESSIGGDEEQHVFIGVDGNLWTLYANGQLTRLGYKEYMSYLDSSHTTIAFDQIYKHFYMTDGTYIFLLTPQGLSQVTTYYFLTSVANVSHFSYPVAVCGFMLGYDEACEVNVSTDTFDMGHRGLKTITRVELGYNASDSASLKKRVNILYKLTEGDTWHYSRDAVALSTDYSDGFPVNNDGIAWCYVTGVEFQIWIEISSSDGAVYPYSGFTLDWMNVWYMNVDKRFRRGV